MAPLLFPFFLSVPNLLTSYSIPCKTTFDCHLSYVCGRMGVFDTDKDFFYFIKGGPEFLLMLMRGDHFFTAVKGDRNKLAMAHHK